jgi:hypothetical protein
MKMTTTTIDSDHFERKARQIRSQVSAILTRWGLLPRFKRWRLTKDPDSGMVVLFGILNNSFIAGHTSTPFSNYFDTRLLRDLANELQVQVVSCNSDGLRYAFILDRGQLGKLPTHIDFPFLDAGKLLVRVVYNDNHPPLPIQPVKSVMADDQTLVRQGVGAFLKVFDDIKLREDAALLLSAHSIPDIVVIGEDEFGKRVEELETNRQWTNRIKRLLAGNVDISNKMQQALLYALVNGGKLYRYAGGFWALKNWHYGQPPWFGTSTITALVSRDLMSYSEWQEGRKGRFPIAAVVSRLLDIQMQPAA